MVCPCQALLRLYTMKILIRFQYINFVFIIDTEHVCFIGNRNVSNPCKDGGGRVPGADIAFSHPSDSTLYLKCDLLGRVYIVNCPQNQTFSDACKRCFNTNDMCIPASKIPPTSTAVSPCTVNNLKAGKFFFAYSKDNTKYIHCDVYGKAWVTSCPTGEVWIQSKATCEPTTSTTVSPLPIASGAGFVCCPTCPLHTTPCTDANIAANKFLHPIKGDKHHYIRCDRTGKMYCPMPCNPKLGGGLHYFDSQTSRCVDRSLLPGSIFG